MTKCRFTNNIVCVRKIFKSVFLLSIIPHPNCGCPYLRLRIPQFLEIIILLGGVQMVLEKVKAILAEQFDYEEDKITPETTIADDLGADSLDVVDLLMSIEDEFEIEVPDEEIENIKTVGDLVKYIEANS